MLLYQGEIPDDSTICKFHFIPRVHDTNWQARHPALENSKPTKIDWPQQFESSFHWYKYKHTFVCFCCYNTKFWISLVIGKSDLRAHSKYAHNAYTRIGAHVPKVCLKWLFTVPNTARRDNETTRLRSDWDLIHWMLKKQLLCWHQQFCRMMRAVWGGV